MTTKSQAARGWVHRLDARLCMLVVAAVAWIACMSVSRLHPAVPQEHDEFSYLLAADTFLEGRLANPAHPMWVHFESVHILQQPMYCSKYPPLPGLVLAFGKLVLGEYVRGVWLAFALACAAVFWMLDAWLSRPAALVSALCLALHAQLIGFWGTTLWGGALPLLGGALVYGALPRCTNGPRIRDGFWLGVGAAVLALSRPYEGLVACLPVLAALLWTGARSRGAALRAMLTRVAAPAAILIACAGAFQALYNLRTTLSATTMAYQIHTRTYEATPLFLMERPRDAPAYRHADLEKFYTDHCTKPYRERRSWSGWWAGMQEKVRVYWRFFFGAGFSLLWIGLPWAMKRSWVRLAAASCVLFAGALAVETYELPHYAAPFLAVVVFLTASSAQAVWSWRWKAIPAGPLGVVSCVVAGLAGNLHAAMRESWHHPPSPLDDRPMIIEKLERAGGKHLVLVKSEPGESFSTEWVYNAPDIDAATIVWARSMDDAHNLELLRYFPDRRLWSIDGPVFERYTGPLPGSRDAQPGTDR